MIEEIIGSPLSSAHFGFSENARRGQHVIESTVTADGVAGVALAVLVIFVMVVVEVVAGDCACWF
jgi:hypothetical protein